MNVKRINSRGSQEYKGQVPNVQQKNKELIKSIIRHNGILPRCVSTLPTIWLYKQKGDDPRKFHDLQVCRENIICKLIYYFSPLFGTVF